ncbi:unnamed protein product [Protopolystoma xenopodis]|uniref:Uncharacterized protein n=1 Tax=Protopolystoma xenopodis TaxID=117903 RepID=A0A3S5AVI8_9PLAT|nr:unnamed protein product [Protopolystoma xenopodis]
MRISVGLFSRQTQRHRRQLSGSNTGHWQRLGMTGLGPSVQGSLASCLTIDLLKPGRWYCCSLRFTLTSDLAFGPFSRFISFPQIQPAKGLCDWLRESILTCLPSFHRFTFVHAFSTQAL